MSGIGRTPRTMPPPTDDDRAWAIRGLIRRNAADLLPALGLGEPEPARADGRQACPRCGGPLPDPAANGGFKACRRRRCAELRTTAESDARSRR